MYWNETAKVPSTLELVPEVAAFLKPGDRVIDLGCGPGRILGELAGEDRFGLLVGADRNMPSLRLAGGRGLPVLRAELAALPFADAAFDAGILHAVLTTLVPRRQRLAVLTEARRVVNRVLCVADFLLNPDIALYKARYDAGEAETGEAGSFLVRESGSDTVLYAAHHHSMQELSGLLSEAGFRVAYAAAPLVRTRSGNVIRGVVLAALTI